MIFSLNHLDLREVQRRGFLNLRVTWGVGCSSGSMNTTRVNEESGTSPEQKEMQEAFRANFNLYDVPEILATPCCSQIAVTKERIRSVPRQQYLHHINARSLPRELQSLRRPRDPRHAMLFPDRCHERTHPERTETAVPTSYRMVTEYQIER